MSWPENQNHFGGENKQHPIGLRASVLYSVLVAEVDVFFFSVIRLRVAEHVTSVGLHVFIPPPQTISIFSIFDTSIH